MKITTLGTSSGLPTATRNVSAVAVSLEREWLLFDCGEGTQRQLNAAGLKPSRLSRIFITHLHGDHVIGLLALLGTLSLLHREESLSVYGPPGLGELLATARRLHLFHPAYELTVHEIEAGGEVYRGADYRVACAALDHRLLAYGYRVTEADRPGKFDLARARELGIPPGPLYGRLQQGEPITLPDGRVIKPGEVVGETRPGRSFVYLTDTRPCASAVRLGQGVDVMLHEATYANDSAELAGPRGHSTAAEAAEVARRAGARQLILTHFSPKYTNLEPLLAEARAIFPATQLAYDLFELTLPPA